MKWVKQLELMGCGPACVAMILGEEYEAATKRFKRDDFTTKGVSQEAIDRILAEAGYAVQRLWPRGLEVWPPKPFAPAHICRMRTMEMVGTTRVHHYVVMDEIGVIYDPDNFDLVSLTQYRWTLDVAGVFKTSDLTIKL